MERVKKNVHLERVYNRGYFGKNVTVAIMDTGMAPHPDLRNQIVAFQDFTAKKNSIYDDNGHGTHIAGILGEMAPKAELVVLKILDKKGNWTQISQLEEKSKSDKKFSAQKYFHEKAQKLQKIQKDNFPSEFIVRR